MAEEFRKIIIKTLFGKPIRKTNYISVGFNAEEYEKLLIQSNQTGINPAKLIAIKSQPCTSCGHDEATIIVKKNQPLPIKKNEKQQNQNT